MLGSDKEQPRDYDRSSVKRVQKVEALKCTLRVLGKIQRDLTRLGSTAKLETVLHVELGEAEDLRPMTCVISSSRPDPSPLPRSNHDQAIGCGAQ